MINSLPLSSYCIILSLTFRFEVDHQSSTWVMRRDAFQRISYGLLFKGDLFCHESARAGVESSGRLRRYRGLVLKFPFF